MILLFLKGNSRWLIKYALSTQQKMKWFFSLNNLACLSTRIEHWTLQILDKPSFTLLYTCCSIITLLVSWAHPHSSTPSPTKPSPNTAWNMLDVKKVNECTTSHQHLYFGFCFLSIFTCQDQSLFFFLSSPTLLCLFSCTCNSHFNLTQLIPFPSLIPPLKWLNCKHLC